jgi:large subunit ribosomal protein L9
MRVVFLEDVAGVAQGGDVKEVKNGFARNYLIPQRLATLATRDALQRIERLQVQADATRLQTLTDMRALSEELDGARIQVEMRAGASGRLYGSVTNITVADEIAELTGRDIDRRTVQIPEPIRQVGLHDVSVRLHPEVTASVSVLVYPIGSDPEEFLASWTEQEDKADQDAGDGAVETVAQAETIEDAADEPDAEDVAQTADDAVEAADDDGDGSAD